MTSFRQVVSYLSGKTSASATPPVSAWETGNRCRCSQIGGIRHTCAAHRCMRDMPTWRMFCRNCFCRPRSVQAPEPSRRHSVVGLQIFRRPPARHFLPVPVADLLPAISFQSLPPASSPQPLRPLLGFLPTADPVRPLPSASFPAVSPPGKTSKHTKKGDPFSGASHFAISLCVETLQLRAGGYESLACLVVLVLVEVVDEASGEILCLLVPYCGI